MTAKKKRIRRLLASLLFAWILVVAWGFAFAWRRLPEYTVPDPVELVTPILTDEQYSALSSSHERPYVVEIVTEHGAVLIYGAEHTKNPDDPQCADIARRWASFGPTIALCESRLGILFPGLMDPVETFAEPGLVHELALDSGLPTFTWEPPLETMMNSLLSQSFSKDQIALRVVLSPYFSNRRFGRPENPLDFVEDTFEERCRWPGIEGTFQSLSDVELAWSKHFPHGPDWRDVSDQHGLPGFLAAIDANRCRDEHFAQIIIDLVRRNERVFAIAGSSHAVKLEPALRATLAVQ